MPTLAPGTFAHDLIEAKAHESRLRVKQCQG